MCNKGGGGVPLAYIVREVPLILYCRSVQMCSFYSDIGYIDTVTSLHLSDLTIEPSSYSDSFLLNSEGHILFDSI